LSRNDAAPPPRWPRPSLAAWLVLLVFGALFLSGLQRADPSLERLGIGVDNLAEFAMDAVPPDFSRWRAIVVAMFETLQMAIVGVAFGVALSFPIALLCARNTSPHAVVRALARMVVTTLRTVPDLIWALVFVIAVGLGPLAGILAIVMDTIGFCARFFSERIEEVDPSPGQALAATGAGGGAVILGAIAPACLPSFAATSLYSVEKAVRSAVVLGLVGAGGIGVELSASMNLFRYDQALTVILVILLVVMAVEQVSGWVRQRVI